MQDNLKHLEYFLNDKGLSRATHPVNPIRVQAINVFAKTKTQEELDEEMEKLISILLKVGNSELDEYMARFIATAGLIVANADGEVTKEEIDSIIENLSILKIFPTQFLHEIANEDVIAIFNDSVQNILNINPGMREGMLSYMIGIIMSDKNIGQEEIELLSNFGSSLGFSKIEIANMLATSIQQRFMPSLEAIC